MAFMGMGMNAAGGMMSGTQQPNTGNSYQPNFGAATVQTGEGAQNAQQGQTAEDPTEKLIKMKKLLDAGVITEEEFAKIKAEVLGL